MKKIFRSLLTLAVLWGVGTVGVKAQTTGISVQPSAQTVTRGTNFTVNINVTNVQNLGAYDINLTYAENILDLVAVENGEFLVSTSERTVITTGPISSSGSVSFGALSFDNDPGNGTAPGPSGNGTLARVTFAAVVNGMSNLNLPTADIYDIDGVGLARTVQGGGVTVTTVGTTPSPSPLAPTPTRTATPSPSPTVMPSPTRTPTPTPTSAPTPTRTPTPAPTPTGGVSPTQVPTVTSVPTASPGASPRGDANCDGRVDDTDYLIWRDYYGRDPRGCPNDADFDDDGDVDLVDYSWWVNSYTGGGATPTRVPTAGPTTTGSPTPTNTPALSPILTPKVTPWPLPTHRPCPWYLRWIDRCPQPIPIPKQ